MRIIRIPLFIKRTCPKVSNSMSTAILTILPAVLFIVLLKKATEMLTFDETSNIDPDIYERLRRFNLHDFVPKLFVPENRFKESLENLSHRHHHHIGKSQKNNNAEDVNSPEYFLGIQSDTNLAGQMPSLHQQYTMTKDAQPKWTHALIASLRAINTSNIYIQRLLEAQNACLRSKPGKAQRIMVNNDKSVAYCVIPKVGCTFWISIFRFIKNDTHGQVFKSPFHIPRWTIHYGDRSKEYTIKNTQTAPAFLNQAFRFMFVRDPYKRLWASWIDKFLLPDYWFTVGPVLLTWKSVSRKKVSQCPVNINFTHFLQFVTDDHFLKYPEDVNEHWAPFHALCDPCVFRPHFIGKMETFEEDSDFVLATTNLTSWVKEDYLGANYQAKSNHTHKLNDSLSDGAFARANTSHEATNTLHKKQKLKMDLNMSLQKRDEHILHEIEMLTRYTFEGVWQSYREIRQCVSKLFLAKRLWLAFQYNGYIRRDLPLKLTNVTRQSWRSEILHAYSKWDSNHTKRHQDQQRQKRNAMAWAYQQVPLNVMRKVQRMFMHDFQQFGYDPQPESLFRNDS